MTSYSRCSLFPRSLKGLGLSSGSGLNLSNDCDYEDEIGNDIVVDSNDENLHLSSVDLSQELVEALVKRGITHLFPIQRAVLVPGLEGRDLIGRAKIGTGKTLAFGIPIIERLIKDNKENKLLRQSRRQPRVLVLAPTRELAKQVEKSSKSRHRFCQQFAYMVVFHMLVYKMHLPGALMWSWEHLEE